MYFSFSYNLPFLGLDLEGTAVVEEYHTDAEGYVWPLIESFTLQFSRKNKRPTIEEMAVETAVRKWLQTKLEADEDLQAAWDAHIGNDELPGYGRPVVYCTYNVQSGSVA